MRDTIVRLGALALSLSLTASAAADPGRPPKPARSSLAELAVTTAADLTGDVLGLALEVETRWPLGAYEARITFDPAVLALVSVEPGTAPGFGVELDALLGAGEVTLAGRNDVFVHEPSGRLELARLRFAILGAPGDFTPVALEDVVLRTTRGRSFLPGETADTAVLVAAFPPPLRAGEPPASAFGEPVFGSGDGKPAYDAAKKAFEAEKKKWQPQIDAIKKKHEEFKAAKGDRDRQREAWDEACRLARELEARVQAFVREQLARILASDPALAARAQKLQEYTIRFWPPLTGATKGRTNGRDKIISLNLDVLDDALSLFSTVFHEAVHATEGTTHATDDLDFYGEELWTEDQENRFLDHIGEPQTAGTTSDEWNYTLRWKEKNGEIKKKASGPGYEATAAGKTKADCYRKHLSDNGWKWDGDPPGDAACVVYYNQIRWKLDKKKEKTAKGEEFTVIETTDTSSIGGDLFAGFDPCK